MRVVDLLKASRPMALENWEIQLLLMLAQNRNSSNAEGLLSQFAGRLSEDGRVLAHAIVQKEDVANSKVQSLPVERVRELANVFKSRADARTTERAERFAIAR